MAKDYKIKTIFEGVDKTSKVLGKMQKKIAGFTHSASMKFRKLDRTLSGMAGTLKSGINTGLKYATAGAVTLGAALWKVMGAFSKFEDAEARFTPLMHGAEGARKLIERLKKEAETTPFEFENLADVAAQLLPVMNSDIEKTAMTMRMMGDVAGGNVQKMESITRGFMKASLKGKVDMESLNMIAEAGVPIFEELAKSMGKETGEKFFKMISAGKVKTADLNKAFKNMTSEGGLFYKGMDLASATLSGRISTLKDGATSAAAELGAVLAPTIKDIVDKAIAFVPVIQQWVVANKDLIRTNVAKFMKEIPGILHDMYSFGKELLGVIVPIVTTMYDFVKFIGPGNLARGTAYFLGLTVLVRGLSTAMTGLNTLANLNVGIISKGAGALGKFNLGLTAIQVFLAGYAIGDLLRRNFVDPLQEAMDKQKKLSESFRDSVSKENDKTRDSKTVLENDVKLAKVELDRLKKSGGGASNPVMKQRIDEVEDYISRLQNRITTKNQIANIEKYYAADQMSYGDTAPWELSQPEVTTSESSTETKILSEVTIVDKTGRARITRGKNGTGGLNLVNTGGM